MLMRLLTLRLLPCCLRSTATRNQAAETHVAIALPPPMPDPRNRNPEHDRNLGYALVAERAQARHTSPAPPRTRLQNGDTGKSLGMSARIEYGYSPQNACDDGINHGAARMIRTKHDG